MARKSPASQQYSNGFFSVMTFFIPKRLGGNERLNIWEYVLTKEIFISHLITKMLTDNYNTARD